MGWGWFRQAPQRSSCAGQCNPRGQLSRRLQGTLHGSHPKVSLGTTKASCRRTSVHTAHVVRVQLGWPVCPRLGRRERATASQEGGQGVLQRHCLKQLTYSIIPSGEKLVNAQGFSLFQMKSSTSWQWRQKSMKTTASVWNSSDVPKYFSYAFLLFPRTVHTTISHPWLWGEQSVTQNI